MPTDTLFEESFGRSADDYAQILRFVQGNNRISYTRFDSLILKKVNLFALPEDFNFEALGRALDEIIRALPAIKRIFAKPITHIKTASEILPVESVRVINNETVAHASRHSELWENITRDGLKPRKLLTQDNRDNYAIYENVVFVRAMDMILSFVSKNIRLLNDILYANRDLKFNLLERENHLSYFLSIGKLHTGYVRDYAKYSAVAENCMDKLLFIDRVIRARTNSPVYKNCRRQTGALALKKTNIFRMHKDYHRIYLMLKWFSEAKQTESVARAADHAPAGEGYGLFCSLLSLFAVGHFNFTFPEQTPIDFYNLDTEASFEGWRVRLQTVSADNCKAVCFTFLKDRTYRVVLLPTDDIKTGKRELELLRSRIKADEYLLASSFAPENEGVYISIFDIDSFRRIQQILLRGMVYSDTSRHICPFCGQTAETNGDTAECPSCRTQILSLSCPVTGQPYYAVKIKNFTPKLDPTADSTRREKRSMERLIAAGMHFRNITGIASGGELICPRCGHIHAE